MRAHLPVRRISPALLATTVLASGCTGSGAEQTTGPSPSPSASASAFKTPDAALITWMDAACRADKSSRDLPPPPRIPEPTVESDRKRLRAYLVDVSKALKETSDGLARLGPSPSPGGDTIMTRYRRAIDDAESKITEYAENTARYPAGSLSSLARLGAMEAVSLPGLAGHLDRGTIFSEAYLRAPNC